MQQAIEGITNEEHVMWFQLRPSLEVANKIDDIIGDMPDQPEGLHELRNCESYEDLVPLRYHHRDGEQGAYLITIFHTDKIDVILLKDHPTSHLFLERFLKEFSMIQNLSTGAAQ